MCFRNIMRTLGNLLVLLALFSFIITGCSSDGNDDSPNPEPYVNVLPAGDYPSIAVKSLSAVPDIGDPILAITAKHTGDFSPLINAYLGKNWHGKACYDKASCLTSPLLCDSWSVDNELWSNQLPPQSFFWDFDWPCPNESYNMTGSQLVWAGDHPQRFKIMIDGLWNEAEFKHHKWVNADIWRDTFFKQVLTHPDLYISMERDWALEVGSDITHSEGTYEITKWELKGVVQSQITTIGETLSLGAEASYGFVSASINATFSSETTNSVEFSEEEGKETKSTYTIPPNETWRFMTLHGIERYYFSDLNGNNWSSTNLDIAEGLGKIENKVRTHLMVAKFRNDMSAAYAIDIIGL